MLKSIRSKLILGMSIILIVHFASGLYERSQIQAIKNNMEQIGDSRTQTLIMTMNDKLNSLVNEVSKYALVKNASQKDEFEKNIYQIDTEMLGTLNQLNQILEDEEAKSILTQIRKKRSQMMDIVTKLKRISKDTSQLEIAQNYLVNQGYKSYEEYMLAVDALYDLQDKKVLEFVNDAEKRANLVNETLLGLGFIFIGLCILMVIIFNRAIQKPIRHCIKFAQDLSQGQFNQEHFVWKQTEFAALHQSMQEMSAKIQLFMQEMKHMSQEHTKGDIDVIMDVKQFEGIYADMAMGVNKMVGDHISVKKQAMACIAEFGKGNFNAPMESLPGKKAFINEIIEEVRANLQRLSQDITELSNGAIEGKLMNRADPNQHQGDFRKLIEGINLTLDALVAPINEVQKQLQNIAKGDLSSKMEQECLGDYAILKSTLNTSLDALSKTISEVNSTVYQVKRSAEELSKSSETVSQGSTESASSIEEISASISELSHKTKQNAQNASMASQLAFESRSKAENGDQQMTNLVTAMKEIQSASRSVSKIIRVIDEIAFQTNLLALNAAVEASRAGVHGKGFAVVAEEVRNLAARSSQAAEETTRMIENTIVKVTRGANLANQTQKSLAEIVSISTRVSDLISEINVASNEQSVGIHEITQGITQLDLVTQQNAAAAEESAASSEILNHRAESLLYSVNQFKLQEHPLLSSPSVDQPQLPIHRGSEDFLQSPIAMDTTPAFSMNDVIDLDDPDFGKY